MSIPSICGGFATLALLLITSSAHAEMVLRSASFTNGATLGTNQVLDAFGCKGGNLSPDLSWSGAPEGTQSFIITVYDPYANTGSGWWHWALFNIPATTAELVEGSSGTAAMPDGSVEARNDFSQNGYSGACPPEGGGPHSYIFTIYAMPEATLPIDESASSAMVGFFARNTALGSASLTASYGR